MLINCPECELQVSTKAITCPHCGYPLQPDAVKTQYIRKKRGRSKLPNGFGQITEIKNKNLRNRYRAMITVGKTPEGKPIQKLLKPQSYFKTYNDAYEALVDYNRNPYDLDSSSITMKQLYDKWFEEYSKNNSESRLRAIGSAWRYVENIYKVTVNEIRIRHLKMAIEEAFIYENGEKKIASLNVKKNIKTIFNQMFDYAIEYEIIDKNYARMFSLNKKNITEKNEEESQLDSNCHIPFAEEEMTILWEHKDDYDLCVDILIIQCYSGFRPQELGLIEIKNVDLNEWTMKGGMKTEAGTFRTVPIHSKIRDLVKNRYDEAISLGSKYLFNTHGHKTKKNNSIKLTYGRYQYRIDKIKNKYGLNPEHRPHDGRTHFVTQAKESKLDEYAIKYIVGHEVKDITERIYTKRNVEWLSKEIEKIP